MLTTTLLFILGFVVLIKAADLLVTGASGLAKRLGVSALVIGLTIVAFGTSTPELVVNLLASINGNTDIAIGNIVGSNIANILLILGISALVYPLTVGRGTVWKEIPFALLAVLVVGVMTHDVLLNDASASVISRGDGLILLAFFAIFLYYIFGIAKTGASDEADDIQPLPFRKASIMITFGLIGLVIGGKWIVDGAVIFATSLGISEAVIGLTVVAVGTSLPELATSIVAAYRRNVDIAVGNIVGSNIFNIFWILGVSAIISPLPFQEVLSLDIYVLIVTTVILFLALFVGKRHTIERWQGGFFLGIYVAYVIYLVVRETM